MSSPENPRRADRAGRAEGDRSAGSPALVRERRLEPYRSPRLVCHGRLAELTRQGGSEVLDSGALGNQT